MLRKYIFMNSRCAVKRKKNYKTVCSHIKKKKSILIWIHLPRERSGNIIQVLETVISEIALSER